MLDASKRGQLCYKGAYSKADLLAVAQRLYNNPSLQFRVPGQRNGIVAIMGPQPAEQVVLVLGTGSSKTLPVMIGSTMSDATTTILILPIVALWANILRRFYTISIRYLVWSVDCKQTASLVIVSAEAACSQSFLEYAHILVSKQKLDRIMLDECHLTITASDWYVRQVRTQTVWLTATLPPVIQEEFIEHNKLVQPRIIDEPTKYQVYSQLGSWVWHFDRESG